MAEGLERESALAGHYKEGGIGAVRPQGPGLELAERRGLSLIQIDGREGDAVYRQAAEVALGLALPETPGTSSAANGKTALWTAPGRWLIVASEGEGPAILTALGEALSGVHRSIIDLSQARCVIRVSGPEALALLSKGNPLDLHPRSFPVGAVAATQLAHVGGTIHHAEDGSYDLYVLRSFALHIWEWALECGEEYGIKVLPA